MKTESLKKHVTPTVFGHRSEVSVQQVDILCKLG